MVVARKRPGFSGGPRISPRSHPLAVASHYPGSSSESRPRSIPESVDIESCSYTAHSGRSGVFRSDVAVLSAARFMCPRLALSPSFPPRSSSPIGR